MAPPSTRTQVLIVWTVICGAGFLGLGTVAWKPEPQCFECGMEIALAEVAMLILVIMWGIVAVVVWFWFAPRD